MSKKFKGFSLAEVLVSLLVISIALSATIPTITKRTSQDRDYVWNWTKDGKSIFFSGEDRNINMGFIEHEQLEIDDDELFNDDITEKVVNNVTLAYEVEGGNVGSYSSTDLSVDLPSLNNGFDSSKLSILKQRSNNRSMGSSHVSFYNEEGEDNQYVGRLALDRDNIALGIGTLINQKVKSANEFYGNNTAIGHYVLMNNVDGAFNVAVGEKALSFNKFGSGNTAIGFRALNRFGIPPISMYDFNTALGFDSLRLFQHGIGNIALGANACNDAISGHYNICLGTGSNFADGKTSDHFSYIVGTNPVIAESSLNGTKFVNRSLIDGHTQKYNKDIDKDLNINARYFNIKPYNGSLPVVTVETFTDKDASENYGDSTTTASSKVDFHLSRTDVTPSENDVSLRMYPSNGNVTFDTTRTKTTAPDDAAAISIAQADTYHHIRMGANGTEFLLNDSRLTRPQVILSDTTTTLNSAMNNNYLSAGTAATSSYSQIELQGNTIASKTLSSSGTLTTIEQKNSNINMSAQTSITLESGKSYPSVYKMDGKGNVYLLSGMNKNNIKDIETERGSMWNTLYLGSYHTTDIKARTSMTMEAGSALYLKSTSAPMYFYANSSSPVVFMGTSYTFPGTLTAQGVNTPSDIRLKNVSGDNTAGLAEINKLEVKNYTYKKDEKKTPHVGVIAQQLQKVFPNSVIKGEDGYLRITREEIFYAMVNSIKELFAKFQDLTAKVTGLDKRINELEAQNKALEKRLEKLEKQAEK